MKKDKGYEWLAGFIYYAEPFDKIITEAVVPFVEKVMKYDWIDQYFFIRYWEKGPHVRLRFLGDPEKIESELKPEFLAYFDEYFKKSPSERTDPEYGDDVAEEMKWYPNNSVQFLPYEPETERYGGDNCLVVSEQHFQDSSQTIFDLMTEGEGEWGYDRAMGAAIQMHLSMAFGLGLDREEMMAFFNRYFSRWLPRAYYFFEKDISKEELSKRRESTLEAFENTYATQKDNLTGFFSQILEILEEGEYQDTWLEGWVEGLRITKEKVVDLQTKNLYVSTAHFEYFDLDKFPKEKQERWALYDSFVHMTNNRLGILNRDEAYLAYIINHTLKLLKKD